MTMTTNPLLEELHAIREKLLADAGGTLDALVDRLQAEESKSDHPRFQSRKDCTVVDSSVDEGDSLQANT